MVGAGVVAGVVVIAVTAAEIVVTAAEIVVTEALLQWTSFNPGRFFCPVNIASSSPLPIVIKYLCPEASIN